MSKKYSGKKIFKVSDNRFHTDVCYIEVAIDFDFPKVKKTIKKMASKFDCSLEKSDNFEKWLKYFLQNLANKAIHAQLEEDWTEDTMQQWLGIVHGFSPLDGSKGITLMKTEIPFIHHSNFEIESVNDFDGSLEIE